MRFLKHLSLNVKLNALLLAVFGLLVVTLLVVINTGFNDFLNQVSQEQIASEIAILQQHFNDHENDVLNAARLLAVVPGLAEAVERGDTRALRTGLLLQAESQGIDDFDIADAAGKRLLSTHSGDYDPEEDRLLGLGLIGAETTGLIAHNDTHHLVAVVTIKNQAGRVVGAVLAGREIDGNFADSLNFGRSAAHAAIIRNGEVIAQTSTSGDEFSEVDEDEDRLAQALRGQVWISPVIQDDANDTPDAIGYAPLRVGGKIQAVLAVRIELGTLLAFQSQLVAQNLAVAGGLALLVLLVTILFIRLSVTSPLTHLKTTAERLAKGDLKQRARVSAEDEIGQLSQSFNIMAGQIETQVAALADQLAETEAARAQAVRSDQVKSAFLASMSHELRTPLNAVINFTRFVIDGDTGPVNAEQAELLGQVVDSARHLLNLINDVLDMSKIEAGSLNLFVEDNIDLGQLVKNAAATAEGLLVGKPVRLRLEVEDNLPRVHGDRQRLLQILLNILSNACKFTEEGEIWVRACQQDGEILLSVTDTGPGIKAEDQALVFEAFKQTQTGLRQGGGTGLGMPIAKNLAEAHGGRLWLESEYGKGTAFYVALPLQNIVPILA